MFRVLGIHKFDLFVVSAIIKEFIFPFRGCQYFHPPEHLCQRVINMGRNYERMRSEMLAKIKIQHQQQHAATSGKAGLVEEMLI